MGLLRALLPSRCRSRSGQALAVLGCALALSANHVRAQTVTPALTLSARTVAGGATVNGTITLPSAQAKDLVVTLSGNGPATTIQPLLPGSTTPGIVIPAGKLTGSFRVNTVPVSRNVSAAISASALGVSTSPLSLTVTAPVISAFTMSAPSVIGPASATGTITLSSAAPSTGLALTIGISSLVGATTPGTLTVPAGATSASLSVATVVVDKNSKVTLTATTPGGASAQAVFSVDPNVPSAVSLSPSPVTGGDAVNGSVDLIAEAPTGGLILTLASSDTSVRTEPGTITVPAGAKSGTFKLSTRAVRQNVSATIGAVSPGGIKATAVLTVTAPVLQSLSSSVLSPLGGTGTTLDLALSGPAPSGGLPVQLASSDTALVVPASVVVPEGQRGLSIPVQTRLLEANRAATVTASVNATGYRTSSTSLAVTVRAIGVASVSFGASRLLAGDSTAVTVTLSDPAPSGGITLGVIGRNGVQVTATSLSFPAGTVTTTTPASAIFMLNSVTGGVAIQRRLANGSTTSLFESSIPIDVPAVTAVSGPTTIADADVRDFSVTFDRPLARGALVAIRSTAGSRRASATSTTDTTALVSTAGGTAGTISIRSPAGAPGVSVSEQLTIANGAGAASHNFAIVGLNPTLSMPDTVVSLSEAVASIALNVPVMLSQSTVLSTSNAALSPPTSPILVNADGSRPFTIRAASVSSETPVTITLRTTGVGRPEIVSTRRVLLRPLTIDSFTVTGGVGPFTGCDFPVGPPDGCPTELYLDVRMNAPAPAGGATVSLRSTHNGMNLPPTVFVPEKSRFGSATFRPNYGSVLGTQTLFASFNGTKSLTVSMRASTFLVDSIVMASDSGPAGVPVTGQVFVRQIVQGASVDTLPALKNQWPIRIGASVDVAGTLSSIASLPAVMMQIGQGSGAFQFTPSTIFTPSAPLSYVFAVVPQPSVVTTSQRPGRFRTVLPIIRRVALDQPRVTWGDSVAGSVELSAPEVPGMLFTAAPAGMRIVGAAGSSSNVRRFYAKAPFSGFPSAEPGPVTITASYPGGTSASASLVVDTGVVVKEVRLPSLRLLGGLPTTATIELTGPAPSGGAPIGVSVGLVNGRSDGLTVTVPSGATSVTTPLNVPVVGVQSTLFVSTSYKPLGNKQVNATVVPLFASLCDALNTPVRGGQTLACSLTLRNGEVAPDGGFAFTFTSSNPAVLPAPAPVTMPAGQSTVPLAISLPVVTQRTEVIVNASIVSGSTVVSVGGARVVIDP